MNNTRKIFALVLAFILTLMTFAPIQAGANFAFAATDTAEQTEADQPSVDADADAVAAQDEGSTITDEDSVSKDTDAEADADIDTEANSDADAETDIEADADKTDADTEADADKSETDAEAEVDADADAASVDEDASVKEEEVKDVKDNKEEKAKETTADKDDEAASKAKETASTIEFKGKEFAVTIDSTPEAGLPADTELSVSEITSKDKEYKEYYEKAIEAAKDDAKGKDTRAVRFVRLYDMTLTSEGEIQEPEANVDVTIDYSKAVEKGTAEAAQDPDSVRVIHFKEDKSGEIEANLLALKHTDATIEDSALTEAKFEAESFSVYAVVYTVDFHYGDGEYDFSIAGESDIMLSEVIERLHMGELTIDDVKVAEFSDSELVKVEKESGDWKLTSLKAFDTDETLTLTLNDGSRVEIKVTDAKMNTDDGSAVFRVTNDSSTFYCTTWKDILDNCYTANGNRDNAVTVELLKDYTFTSTDIGAFAVHRRGNMTIDGKNHVITRGAGVQGSILTWNPSEGNNTDGGRGTLIIKDLDFDNGNVNDSSSFVLSKKKGVLKCTNVEFNGNNTSSTVISVEANDSTFTDCSISGGKGNTTVIAISGGNTVFSGGSIERGYSTGNIITDNGTGYIALRSIMVDGTHKENAVSDSHIIEKTNTGAIYLGDNQNVSSETGVFIIGGNTTGNLIQRNSNGLITLTKTTITGAESGSAAAIYNGGANDITIQENSKIYRGESTGAAVVNDGNGKLIITSSTISGAKSASDSASVTATQPLVKQGTGALTLTNAVIEKHVAGQAGVCAVDASSVTGAGNVKVSSGTTITGNTAKEKPANLKVNGTNVLQISSSLTGTVGVTTNRGETQQFATRLDANRTGYENLINDKDGDLISVLSGNNIFWQAKPGALLSFAIGNNKYKTLQGAFNAASNGAVIKSLVEEYTFEGTESCDTNAVTVQPGDNFDWLTLKRGDADGDMITSSKKLTLKNVVLDGQNIQSTGSLLKMTGGVDLILTDVTARNHTASSDGICAVDAEAASAVTLDKATTIIGNTAAGSAANLKIPDAANKTKIAALSGRVGITSVNNQVDQCFAYLNSSSETSGIAFLLNDADRVMRAVQGNSTGIYWSMAQQLPTSKFYITGDLKNANNVTLNNITLYYDTLEETVDVSTDFIGEATIHSMVSEYTMKEPIVFSHDVTLKPGNDASGNAVSSLTIYRGEEPGTLMTHNLGQLTLQNVILDGQNHSVTGPMMRSTGGAGNLIFDNVTVRNHTASENAIYAIDASDNKQKIKLQGNTNITGNMANGSAANLCVAGTNRLTVFGDLTGSIGITNLLHEQPGDQFGVLDQNSYTIGTITNDLWNNNPAEKDGTKLVWKGSTVSTGNLVKLTDGTNVLKRKVSNNNYADAVYTSVNGNASAVYDVNHDNLYNADGTKYTGTVYFEFLQDRVNIGNANTDEGVEITHKRDLVFRTASKTATDGYPFKGTGTRTKIVFTNGGGNGNTDKRFYFTGDGSRIRFENIIVDGRADQGIKADQGSLVSVGDRASKHDIEVTIGEGAVFQNGASNNDDQGGGFYVGNGCKLYMEPGSVIQYCLSNTGNSASGGAIYLAMGELYCNGGIIRNCVCSTGGAIDCGGTTDNSVSDKARVYFSGSPQIINNYDNSGNPMNFHLNYDSNNIITISGDLDANARVGVSADGNAGPGHSKEGQPFGNIAPGANVADLASFVNDKDTRLTGAPGVGSGNERLAVWFYQMNACSTDDYIIDGELIRTTEISGSEGTYEPERLPTEFTVENLEGAYHNKYPYISFKKSDFSGISLVSYDTNPGISSGITHLRYTTYMQGRRWEYSMDGGEHWFGVNGREIVFHYTRENRDNIKLNKVEDTNSEDLLEGAKFRLERSYPDRNSYSLYTNGAGKGRTGGLLGSDVIDTSTDGIYTTDEDGSFIMNLPEGYYRLTETKAPEGYDALTEPITFHVKVDAVLDTSENEQVSPYSVDGISSNTDYEANSYSNWKSKKYIGAFTVKDVRQVPVHVLLQKNTDAYELHDDTTCTAEYTDHVTAPLSAETTVTGVNAAKAGYKRVHVFYGKSSGGSYQFEKSGADPIEVTKLKGTANGIIVNGASDNVLTKDMALYYVFVKDVSPKVTYDANGGSFTEGNTFDETVSFEDTEFTKVYDVSDTTPTWENHIFVGWNTKADGSGTTYNKDSTITFDRDEHSSDITLYAQWKEITFLRVTKVLPGDYDNRLQEYSFNISIDGGSKAIKVYGNTEQELTSGSFTLKHNESILFKVPADTKITIAETKVTGYDVKIRSTNINSPSIFSKNEDAGSVEVTLKQSSFTANVPADVTFSNTLAGPVVPTGLTLKNWTGRLVFMLVALILAAETALFIRRRRHRA